MLLYGAGGHARVVIDTLLDLDIEINGIFDDHSDLVSVNGFDVLGDYDENEFTEDLMIISVGDNLTRRKLALKSRHAYGTVVHPSAICSRHTSLGDGTVILHNTVVQTGVKIGKHCILNTSSSVDHDTELGDFVHISPKVTLCDRVKVGEGTHIGAGATVIPQINIGKWCVIGAGAVITQNLPDYSLVVGVPGKVIRKINEDV